MCTGRDRRELPLEVVSRREVIGGDTPGGSVSVVVTFVSEIGENTVKVSVSSISSVLRATGTAAGL